MTHRTRFTIFTEFEEVPYQIELTSGETHFVMAHCPGINSLIDYIRSLPADRIVRLKEAS